MAEQLIDMPKILVIDDDLSTLELVSRILKKRDFNAIVVSDSTRAMDIVNKEQPALVLLDLVMPRVCGTEILESIRAQASPVELPVMMLTAINDSADITRCLKLGANDYLTKPIEPDVMEARIRTQLRLVELNRENLSKKEIETLHAMIVTYNHEINNPLAAAMLSLTSDLKDMSQDKLDVARGAVLRISEILKKIDHVTENGMRKERYGDHSAIFKL